MTFPNVFVSPTTFALMNGGSGKRRQAGKSRNRAAGLRDRNVPGTRRLEGLPTRTPVPPARTPVPPARTLVPSARTPVPPAHTSVRAARTLVSSPRPSVRTTLMLMPAAQPPVPGSRRLIGASLTFVGGSETLLLPAGPPPAKIAHQYHGIPIPERHLLRLFKPGSLQNEKPARIAPGGLCRLCWRASQATTP